MILRYELEPRLVLQADAPPPAAPPDGADGTDGAAGARGERLAAWRGSAAAAEQAALDEDVRRVHEI